MKELLILSGKGGTGKTSLSAALATLLPQPVLADCDVDAADLHLLLSPRLREEHEFWSGVEAEIDATRCTGCGTCAELCHFSAIELNDSATIRPFSCEGCGVCARFCPEQAISLRQKRCGSWFLSDTDWGPMFHARLGIGEENSGKLVSLVKRQARATTERTAAQWLLVDGPPGIGCPVIAALSGADRVMLVTEPSLSGLHDLVRVADLARHFKVPAGVCINKWDLHPGVSAEIELVCQERGLELLGSIPYDRAAMDAVVHGRPVTLHAPHSLASRAIHELGERLLAA